MIFRCADHGEMGLSHGGLRQKAFNAYEETIHIPLVVSNPVLFPKPVHETDALASLVDVLPTVADAGRAPSSTDEAKRARPDADPRAQGRPRSASDCDATDVDLGPVTAHPSPAPTRSRTRSTSPMTTTRPRPRLQNVPGQPNRIRAVRTEAAKFALYFDPAGRRPPEYEMYDLDRDPNESHNLVDRRTGRP